MFFSPCGLLAGGLCKNFFVRRVPGTGGRAIVLSGEKGLIVANARSISNFGRRAISMGASYNYLMVGKRGLRVSGLGLRAKSISVSKGVGTVRCLNGNTSGSGLSGLFG